MAHRLKRNVMTAFLLSLSFILSRKHSVVASSLETGCQENSDVRQCSAKQQGDTSSMLQAKVQVEAELATDAEAKVHVEAELGTDAETESGWQAEGQFHRFCKDGREVDLCRFHIPEFSGYIQEKFGTPKWKSKGTDCLNLTSLVTEDPELCKNWETAVTEVFGTPRFRLVKFWVTGTAKNAKGKNSAGLPPGIQGVRDSFPVISKWSHPPKGTHWILNEFYENQYQLNELNMPDGECFLDIGGNIGIFSLCAAQIFHGVRGSSFEPSPLNFLLNYANIANNNLLGRVNIYNTALTSDGSPLPIGFDLANPGGSQAWYGTGAHGKQIARESKLNFMTPSLTFHQALATCETKDKVVAKMDCEGCEYVIWKDVRKHKERLRVMRGEVHDKFASKFKGGVDNMKEMTAFFESLNGGWVHND